MTPSLGALSARRSDVTRSWRSPGAGIDSARLSTPYLALCFLLVMAAIISRRPDWITNPQFFGDEILWYRDAYRYGAFHSLMHPYQGYFVTAQKIINVLAVRLPVLYAPLLCSASGILIHTITFWYPLTSRLERAAPVIARGLICFLWIGVPNSAELLTMTNTQWILGLLGALIVVSQPPDSRAWEVFDVAAILLMGLTGPYCILLLPIAFAMWLARRARWTLFLFLLMIGTASIQVLALRHWVVKACAGQHMTGIEGLDLVATKIFLAGALGTNAAALHTFLAKGAILAGGVVVIGASIVLLTLLRAPLELRLFVAFGWLIAAAATYRLHCDAHWDWQSMLTPAYAERYWYITKLGFIASIVWLALSQRVNLILRIPVMLAVLLFAVVALASWRYPRTADLNWPQYAKALEDAPAGATVVVPVNPGGLSWDIPITKH